MRLPAQPPAYSQNFEQQRSGIIEREFLAKTTVANFGITDLERNAGIATVNTQYVPGDVRRFGAVCNGSTDDSASVNVALSVGGRVFIPSGLTCKASNLTMAVEGTEFVIEAGATLSNPTATNKAITVSGANCTISGTGRILSPATFDGTNSQRTYAVLWITGDGSLVKDIRIENVPRAGIHYENSTLHRVEAVRIIGNYPYSSYTTNTTAQVGIDYDPKTTTYANSVGVVVVGCLIETCIQGFLLANYGAAPLESGISIIGNTFNRCWDHGVYLIGSEGCNVGNNSFVNCRIPIVVDGQSPTVTGNAIYATEPTQTNGAASISVRDCDGAVIVGNSMYGLAAGIDCNNVSGTEIRNCVIKGNTIYRTGSDTFVNAIRLGSSSLTEICTDNVIESNVIYGAGYSRFAGAIQIQAKSGFFGERNVVRGNTVRLTAPGTEVYCIYALRQKYATIAANTVSCNDTATGAKTYDMVFLSDCDDADVDGNTLVWAEGGTNITARGIRIASDCAAVRVGRNRFFLTASGLTAATPVSDAGSGSILEPGFRQASTNTATPSGATSRQLPLYDASGTLVGYVPVYGSAWA